MRGKRRIYAGLVYWLAQGPETFQPPTACVVEQIAIRELVKMLAYHANISSTSPLFALSRPYFQQRHGSLYMERKKTTRG